jgi:hypothetical protein
MKTEKMDMIDIIIELESGSLLIEDRKDLERVKDVCRSLASSQGFYGRLLEDLDYIELPAML